MSIQDSDYVFSVKGDASTDQNVRTLVSALQKHGFQAQARPGLGKSALVFVKLSASAYSDIVTRDLKRSARFGVSEKDEAGPDRSRLVYAFLIGPTDSKEAPGVGITPRKGAWKFVESLLPNTAFLADKSVAKLGQKAAFAPTLTTPNFIKTHGPQVALYFEFLKFYILALGFLSIFGAVAFVKSKTYSLTYSFVNLVWAISFLLLWKRKERALANAWGVQNTHKVEEYDADLAVALSKSSQGKGNRNKAGVRFWRELAFVPIALLFVAVLVSYQLACFFLEIFLSEIYDGPAQILFKLIPTVLLAVFVPILTLVYNFIVDKFLNWEGHDNNYTRYDSFVVKTFTLNFLTGYVPLLITAFIYLPFAHFIAPELPVIKNLVIENIHEDRYAYKLLTQIKSQKSFEINQSRLDGQFFFFIVTNQIISFMLRYALPLVLRPVLKLVFTKVLGKKEDEVPVDAPEEKEWLSAVRQYIELPEYNIHDDYRGLCLQFGYLAMFGPVWTLAPLLSMVFNVLTFKLDTWKLTSGKYFRPPVPKRVDSIHPWDVAFFSLAWLGSIVSPAVTAFYRHGTKPPKTLGQFALEKASINVSSTTSLLATLFASEHLFFALLFIGNKALSFTHSESEIANVIQNAESGPGVSAKSSKSVDKSADWKSLSLDEISKQASGVRKPVSQEKASSSGVSTSEKSGEQTLSNRNNKLEELEKKKAQLERVRQTLEKQKLETQQEKGDTIISTIDAQGNKIQAIIDGDQHIPMSEVDDIEKKLAENKKKQSEKDVSKDINKVAKKDVAEKDYESSPSDTNSRSESSEETSSSGKPSKKKSLKKFLKRG